IEAVVFDLGGVLIHTSKMTFIREIGLITLLKYILTLHNPKLMQKQMFEILHKIEPLDSNGPGALSPDGKQRLPQLMQDWLSGAKSSVELLEKANDFVDAGPGLFDSGTQQRFIRTALNVMFSPKIFTKAISLFARAIKFVKQCKERGLKILVLSNFDAESYELSREKYPELFELFEEKNIFISGKLGTIKPDPKIYQILLDQSGLDPASCVFFDDQQENVDAAKQCGFNAMLVERKKGWISSEPDYDSMQKELDRLVDLQRQETMQVQEV
ncbi:HAD-IA family hydrolase, partial [bacterium]|nr:HAD-IA family hydrolase [bacterium]